MAFVLQITTRMRAKRVCFALASTLLGTLVACTTGSNPVDAMQFESGTSQLGIICSTFYATSGSFVPDLTDPPPKGFDGCWPVGKWTFSLTISTDETSGGGSDSCMPIGDEQTPLAMYQFTGTTTLDADGDPEEQFAYNPQTTDPNVNNTIKVTEGGSGICEGKVALYDSTGTKVWTLSPELNADNSLTGAAEFDLWGTDQWSGD